MSQMNERGAKSERSSALWGTGGRGGDRSSVLWGKGGRGALVAAMALVLMAAIADTGPSPSSSTTSLDVSGNSSKTTFVAPGLLKKAQSNPNDLVSVIITSTGGGDGSRSEERRGGE